MKVLFISNYFNHHQKHISEVLERLSEYEYSFVETTTMSEERKQLGYGESEIPNYVMKFDYEHRTQILKDIMEADLVIWGGCSNKLVKERIKNGKLTFNYSERLFKKNSLLLYIARYIKYNLKIYGKKTNHYLLCASAFASSDYQKFNLFKGRTIKWGYFPPLKIYDDIEKILNKKNKKEILWCGRFLAWKHPDDLLTVAVMLKNEGYEFNIKLIGTGEMEDRLRNYIEKYDLNDCVEILKPQKPDRIREYMEQAGIYVCTSDFREGWGAVMNEAMNSGCAVVASHAMGATPFLIDNKKNGLIYKSRNVEELCEKIKLLLDDLSIQKQYGKEAYNTIKTEWNAEIAAERLMLLSSNLLQGDKNAIFFETGPCSIAEPISNDWYQSTL